MTDIQDAPNAFCPKCGLAIYESPFTGNFIQSCWCEIKEFRIQLREERKKKKCQNPQES